MPVDPELQAVLDAIASLPEPDFETLDAAELRAVSGAAFAACVPTVEVASVEDRAIPGPAGDIPVRIYRPERDGTLGVLVYLHGGGWVIYGLDSHDNECRQLANGAGVVVVSVDYRLAPEHRFPAPLDDAMAAIEWTAAHAAELGADPARLAVGGDSAGGNLAAVSCLLARDRGAPAIAHQVLLYPVIDLTGAPHPSRADNASGYLLSGKQMDWFERQYVRTDADRHDPLVSPILAPSHAGLPPALVLTAEYDPLRDEGDAYAAALERAGVAVTHLPVAGAIHGFLQTALMPSGIAKRAMDDVCAALDAAIGPKATGGTR